MSAPPPLGCSIRSWLANTLLDSLADVQRRGTLLRTAPASTVPMNAVPSYERGTELARTVHHILAVPTLGTATASIYRSHNARHPGFLVPPDPSAGDGGITALMQLRYFNVGLQSGVVQSGPQGAGGVLCEPRAHYGRLDPAPEGSAADGAAAEDQSSAAA